MLLLATMAVALLLACAAALAADAQDYEAQVVGGTAVPDGKYPFMAALLDVTQGSTEFDQQFCGGTLIDQNSVLTAAHCVEGMSATLLRITVGRTVLNSDQGRKLHVSKIFVHPNYNDSTLARDAAVLRLSRSVSGISPIELATAAQNNLEKAGRSVTVAGWGSTSKGSPTYPNRMREAQVPIVSDSRAERVYDAILGPAGYIPPIMVAAGRVDKKSACYGDSGGPLFDRASGRYIQIGITSFQARQRCTEYPTVYAEVNASSINSFITDAARR